MATGTHTHNAPTPAGWHEIVNVPLGLEVYPGGHWRSNDTGQLPESNPYRPYLKTTPIRGYPGDRRDSPEGEGLYDPHGMHTTDGKLVIPLIVGDKQADGSRTYYSSEVRPEFNWSEDGVMSDKINGSYLMQICMRAYGPPGWGAVALIMPQDGNGIKWPATGEYDWPEIDGYDNWAVKGHHHPARADHANVWPMGTRQDGTDWHLYEIEVVTGQYVEYRVDGEIVWHSRQEVTQSQVLYGNLQCGLNGTAWPTKNGAVEVDFWRVLKKS